jgi:2'-5' RNA ligase
MSPILNTDIRLNRGHRFQYALDLNGFPPGNDGIPRPAVASRVPEPVFFAVYPTLDVAQRLSRLAWHFHDKERLKGMPLGQKRFHTTLHPVGYYENLSPEDIDEIGAAVSTIKMPPFVASFDYAMSFTGKDERPLVLRGNDGVSGLTLLRDELVTVLQKIGFAHQKVPEFTPHITLLYDEHAVREQAVEEISWTVRDFVLVRSLYGQSQHNTLGRWPLRAAA